VVTGLGRLPAAFNCDKYQYVSLILAWKRCDGDAYAEHRQSQHADPKMPLSVGEGLRWFVQ
jgi:hypothetical protein